MPKLYSKIKHNFAIFPNYSLFNKNIADNSVNQPPNSCYFLKFPIMKEHNFSYEYDLSFIIATVMFRFNVVLVKTKLPLII